MEGVAFTPRRGRLIPSRGSAIEEGLELVQVYGDARGDAVDRAADRRGVRLPEDRYAQRAVDAR